MMRHVYRSVTVISLFLLLAGFCFAQATQDKKSYTFHGKIDAADANGKGLKSRQGVAALEQSIELPLAASLEVKLKLSAQTYSVTVTAANDSFAPVDTISATRKPIDELPQSVGIVNRTVLDSEQALRIADAARNVTGVERDTGALGDVAELVHHSWITLDTFNSYFRDGYRYEGGTPRYEQLSQ